MNMDQKQNEIVKDKDILGMDKPENQLKPLKRKSDMWFLVLMLIILMIGAVLVLYLKK